MIDGRMLLAAVVAAHILLGVYAAYDGGFFIYGVTAPERFIWHLLTQSESHITLSGASKYVADDLCLQDCRECTMHCYEIEQLRLGCGGSCLETSRGTLLASEEDRFAHVLKSGVLLEDVVFRCHEACGFDSSLGGNFTYSSYLPEIIS